jgi:hypothetical protein
VTYNTVYLDTFDPTPETIGQQVSGLVWSFVTGTPGWYPVGGGPFG